MALANKFRGWLVLICGNKSELAVGYTTIYGVDMAGGFAVIKDVFKTKVYELARARNEVAGYDLIPETVLDKPPSAELAPGQRDDQNLPPYELLDPILAAYVERDMTRGRADRGRVRSRRSSAHHAARRRGGVEATPGADRCACHAQGVRQGSTASDHQQVRRLTRSI